MKPSFLALLLLIFSTSTHSSAVFPSKAVRLKMFDQFVTEIERLDGDGLLPRKNRPEPWKKTIQKLRKEMEVAENPVALGRVFKRLDATYPNLHAKVRLLPEYDPVETVGRPQIAAVFAAEIVTKNQKKYTYRISSVKSEQAQSIPEAQRPAVGDFLIAINGRPMAEWSHDGFIFCKHPLREQCELNLFDALRHEVLSWERSQKLVYTLKRGTRTWDVEILTPNAAPKPSSKTEDAKECGVAGRYPGFQIRYQGINACAFESAEHPNVVVLRISSFAYRDLPKESKIQNIVDETKDFWENYWQIKAPTTAHVIIDVLENGGGDEPIEWYRLFYSKPFQEQYVQSKKIPELENEEISKALFYESRARVAWLEQLRSTGAYGKIKTGDFLPTHPQFCAHQDKICGEGLYEPRRHAFKGDVRILVEEWCISSCAGFVWSFKQELKERARLYGVPDSGDTSYGRLYLNLMATPAEPSGSYTTTLPRNKQTQNALPAGAILRETVPVTLSTDAVGKVISGQPTPVDVWVPRTYHRYDHPWETKVFLEALKP